MSNWAKLQEQLTGKRVVKRAKHGIHFDNGDGSITANFSGKPCHFQDTDGLWKPIDTRLLLGADGFYGCPHSPVKVKPDGRVKVTGSDYSQFTEFPGSPLGRVDGDKIVREFPGGYQELFVTEDGFREVITVNKPTFPIEKFLAKQSGTLPSAYKTSPQTAVDANGNEFVITSDTKAFGDWMEGAAYPVVIDPDFQIGNTTYGDTHLDSNGGYALVNRGATTTLNATAGNVFLMRFDLTTIPASATCDAATLTFTKQAAVLSSLSRTVTIYSIASGNTNWIEGTGTGGTAGAGEPCWNALAADGSGGVTTAWAGSAGLSTSGTDYEATAIGTFNLNRADEVGTQYSPAITTARVKDWFGETNTNYGMKVIGTGTGCVFYSSEDSTSGNRPYLSVTYTAAATGTLRRTNMNAQMSNLTGGMHG